MKISQARSLKVKRDRALVLVFFHLALRTDEVVPLDIEDYDAPAKEISVPGHGNAKRERVKVTGPTAKAIEDWIEARGETSGPLFVALDNRAFGRRVTRDGIVWIMKRALSDFFSKGLA